MSASIAKLAKLAAEKAIAEARAAAARQDRAAVGRALTDASTWAQLAEVNGAARPSVPWSLLDGLPAPWPAERGRGRTVPMFANPQPGPDLALVYFKAAAAAGRRREVLAKVEAETLRQVGTWIHQGRDPRSIVLWASNGTFTDAAILPMGYPQALPEYVSAAARLQAGEAVVIDALTSRLVLASDALSLPPRQRRVGAALPKRTNAPKPSNSSKPPILRGRAREVLARAGSSATLAELAALACTDERGARRIARTLERAGAAVETGKDRWKLDAAPLEQCPPPRVATVRAVAPCAGECGAWKPAPKGSPTWIAALGPTAPVYDSEGRRYRVQYALARVADLGRTWHASHVAGRSDPGYLAEFQARSRGSAVSDAQVAAIADALDVARWIAPSATPTDGTPIVWSPRIIPPRAQVLAGNGRIAAWIAAAPDAGRVASALEERWRIPAAVRSLLAVGGLVPVRVLEAPKDRALLLAAASQSAAGGALTASERATTAVRSLGLTVETMPGIDWPRPLTPANVGAFAGRNAAWLEWSLAPLDRARRITIQGDPALLSEHAIGVLVGLLPAEARVPPIGGTPLDRALLGALPGIWTSRALVRTLEAGAEWDLTTAIGPARAWARRLKPDRLAALGSELAQAERQSGLFDDTIAPDADPRSAALGAVLARAAGRASPEDAAAEYLERFLAAIPDPRQVSMMMLEASAPDAAEVLGAIARVKIKRTNPRRSKLLASWAAAWHWGRYSAAQVAQVERAPSDPASGFALGELAAITVDGRRYLAPPGHLLCANKPGKAARLFVAPPLALPETATGPIGSVEYLADKGTDGLSHYVHDFSLARPEVTHTCPMRISRAHSQFSVDLDRGIVR